MIVCGRRPCILHLSRFFIHKKCVVCWFAMRTLLVFCSNKCSILFFILTHFHRLEETVCLVSHIQQCASASDKPNLTKPTLKSCHCSLCVKCDSPLVGRIYSEISFYFPFLRANSWKLAWNVFISPISYSIYILNIDRSKVDGNPWLTKWEWSDISI